MIRLCLYRSPCGPMPEDTYLHDAAENICVWKLFKSKKTIKLHQLPHWIGVESTWQRPAAAVHLIQNYAPNLLIYSHFHSSLKYDWLYAWQVLVANCLSVITCGYWRTSPANQSSWNMRHSSYTACRLLPCVAFESRFSHGLSQEFQCFLDSYSVNFSLFCVFEIGLMFWNDKTMVISKVWAPEMDK